ncbi:MAG: hypothetical protein ABI623_02685 [bacterium]
MIRFFFIIGILWLVSKIAGIIFRSLSQPSQNQTRRTRYGFTKPPSSSQKMDFKNVQDAEFEELPDKENSTK